MKKARVAADKGRARRTPGTRARKPAASARKSPASRTASAAARVRRPAARRLPALVEAATAADAGRHDALIPAAEPAESRATIGASAMWEHARPIEAGTAAGHAGLVAPTVGELRPGLVIEPKVPPEAAVSIGPPAWPADAAGFDMASGDDRRVFQCACGFSASSSAIAEAHARRCADGRVRVPSAPPDGLLSRVREWFQQRAAALFGVTW